MRVWCTSHRNRSDTKAKVSKSEREHKSEKKNKTAVIFLRGYWGANTTLGNVAAQVPSTRPLGRNIVHPGCENSTFPGWYTAARRENRGHGKGNLNVFSSSFFLFFSSSFLTLNSKLIFFGWGCSSVAEQVLGSIPNLLQTITKEKSKNKSCSKSAWAWTLQEPEAV